MNNDYSHGYKHDFNIVSSVFRNNSKHIPKDLYESTTYIPLTYHVCPFGIPKVLKPEDEHFLVDIKADANLFPNIHGILCPYVKFNIPEIYAQSYSDFFKYCDVPALYIFRNISLLIDNNTHEVLSSSKLEYALKVYFKDNYQDYANLWLGGIDGPNQKYSYCDGSFVFPLKAANAHTNRLKKEIECILPLPFNIFRTNEIYPYQITQNSKLSLKFELGSLADIMTGHIETIKGFSLPLSLFMSYVKYNHYVFNNIPHVYPESLETPFLFEDRPLISNKLDTKEGTLDFTLIQEPTVEYLVNIYNSNFSSNKVFLGEDNEMCRANWVASQIIIKNDMSKVASCFCFKTMKFLNSSSSFTTYEIIKIDEYRFLVKTHLQALYYETIISSNIPFSEYHEDILFSFVFDEGSKIKLEYFRTINFQIEEFDKFSANYFEDNVIINGAFRKLHKGYFTFVNTENQKKYAFYKINNLTRNKFVQPFDYDVNFCLPLATPGQSQNFFINDKFVTVNLPSWIYYDLDKNYKIDIENYGIVNKNTTTTSWPGAFLEIERARSLNKQNKYLFDNFQLHKKIDVHKNDVSSCGFEMLDDTIRVKLRNYSDDTKPFQLKATIIQVILKIFKCSPHRKSESIKNLTIYETELLSNDVLTNETESGVFQGLFVLRKDKTNEEQINPKSFSISKNNNRPLKRKLLANYYANKKSDSSDDEQYSMASND